MGGFFGRLSEARAQVARLFDALEDEMEDMEALAAYHATRGEESFPGEVVSRLLDGQAPVRVFREHRRMDVAALAAASGVSTDTIAAIEAGGPALAPDIKALAAALRVDMEDLV
jgi:DNA-binding XRE family transcriptional regulator